MSYDTKELRKSDAELINRYFTNYGEAALTNSPFNLKLAKHGCICPKCQNGSGESGTGLYYDATKQKWRCMKCGTTEDCIGWYMIIYNKGFKDAIDDLRSLTGIGEQHIYTKDRFLAKKNNEAVPKAEIRINQADINSKQIELLQKQCELQKAKKLNSIQEKAEIEKKNKATILRWQKHNDTSEYLQSRGLSKSTIAHYGAVDGVYYDYDEDAKNSIPRPATLIPNDNSKIACNYSYNIRIHDATTKADRFRFCKGYKSLFNLTKSIDAVNAGTPKFNKATQLYHAGRLIITESIIDAMSIYEATGLESIALNGAKNHKLVIDEICTISRLQEIASDQLMPMYAFLWLDSDEAGKESTIKLAKDLHEDFGLIVYSELNESTNKLDSNGILQAYGKNILASYIKKIIKRYENQESERKLYEL